MVEPEKNTESHKDSCNYGIELSKLFITLASGGLAFATALGLANLMVFGDWRLFWTLLLFAISIGFGLAFVMSVVGHINKHNNYDVYTICPRLMMVGQLLAFGIAIYLVAAATLACVESQRKAKQTPSYNLVVTAGNKRIEQDVPLTSKVTVTVTDPNGISVKTEPYP